MNARIDYKSIVDLIRQEFIVLQRSDDKFSEILFDVEDERLLAKNKDRDPKRLYIQIKFGAANTFGQASVPFSLETIGINQDTELTQEFLESFVNTYNTVTVGNAQQFFLTPVVSQNNIPIYEGYRSLFIISGTVIILPDLIAIDSFQYINEDNETEDIEIIAFNDVAEASLNPQPYPNTGGRAKSYGSFMTNAFTITLYPDANKEFVQKLFAWKYDKTRSHQNDTFKMNIVFKDTEYNMNAWEFKCRSCEFAWKIGESPAITATFTL